MHRVSDTYLITLTRGKCAMEARSYVTGNIRQYLWGIYAKPVQLRLHCGVEPAQLCF